MVVFENRNFANCEKFSKVEEYREQIGRVLRWRRLGNSLTMRMSWGWWWRVWRSLASVVGDREVVAQRWWNRGKFVVRKCSGWIATRWRMFNDENWSLKKEYAKWLNVNWESIIEMNVINNESVCRIVCLSALLIWLMCWPTRWSNLVG